MKPLTRLGLDRDSVSVTVLAQAKSGFLGFGAQPAKVQVTYEVPMRPRPQGRSFCPVRRLPEQQISRRGPAQGVSQPPKAEKAPRHPRRKPQARSQGSRSPQARRRERCDAPKAPRF